MTQLPADWPLRVHSRFVRAGGLEWHVQITGDGPVLLLIHGTGAATHSWRDVIPLAAERHTVIAFDLPGHGFTKGRPASGMGLPSIARAVGALLTELKVEPVAIVGHSAGAAVALQLVIAGHAKPAAVVGIAAALLPFPGIAQHVFPTLAKLLFVNPFAPHIFAQIARGPGAVAGFLERSTGSRIDAAGIAAYAELFGRSAHCAGAIAMMSEWDLAPLKHALPGMTISLLLLHGDKDSAIPVSGARAAAALVPRAEIEILSGLGHLAHEEAPDATTTRIMAFVEDRER